MCKAILTLIYFKLEESLWHSSLNFLLEFAMQLQKYIWISWVGEWMKCMYNLSDKFGEDIIIYANYCIRCGREEVQIS